MHCKVSGVADHYAQNDEHAIMIARNCVKNLSSKKTNGHYPYAKAKIHFMIPKKSMASFLLSLRMPMDIREIIARIVDGSEFYEFKALYGITLVCGFAHIHGIPRRHYCQQWDIISVNLP